jgi:hypothetical protein
MTTRVADDSSALELTRRYGYGGALHTKHLRQELLREEQRLGFSTIG